MTIKQINQMKQQMKSMRLPVKVIKFFVLLAHKDHLAVKKQKLIRE